MVSIGGNLYARTDVGLLWLGNSQDWHMIPTRPGDGWFCQSLASGTGSPASPLYALAGESNAPYLYVSFDGGRSWTQRSLPLGFGLGITTGIAGSSQAHSLYLLSGNERGYTLYGSVDDGQRWTEPLRIGSPPHPPTGGAVHHTLIFAGALYIGTKWGIYRYDYAPDWDPADAAEFPPVHLAKYYALDAMAVSANNPQHLAAAALVSAEEFHLQITQDGGKTWVNKDPYTCKFRVDDLLFVDELLFARAGHWDPANGKFAESILVTSDGGDAWTDITTPELAALLVPNPSDNWGSYPGLAFGRDGLAAGAGRLFILGAPIGLYSIELSSVRALVK